MSQTSHDISTLNGLIATTYDSVEGYEAAAEKSGDGDLFGLFNERAMERQAVITTLRAEVIRLGGEPEDDGTLLAGAHRMFLNLKSVVTGNDDKAIIDEVEQGEDHIKGKFEDALEDTEVSAEVSSTIRQCYTSIKQGHDQMRNLKHAMEGDGSPRL